MIVNRALMAEEKFYRNSYREADLSGNLYSFQERARKASDGGRAEFLDPYALRFWKAWNAHGQILRTQRDRRWRMRTEQVVRVSAYPDYPEFCNGIWHHTRHPGGKHGLRPHSTYEVCDCGSVRLNSYLSSIPFVPEKRP